jgi:hypothetical protein
VRGDVWGLDDKEELYVTLNVGLLVMEPGASLVIRGNVFSLLCQTIVNEGDPATVAAGYQIGILPTPFSVDSGHGPMDGPSGADGSAGRDGACGNPMSVENSILGFRLREEVAVDSMHGQPGEDGRPGGDGGHGRNGGMCKLAALTLRRVKDRSSSSRRPARAARVVAAAMAVRAGAAATAARVTRPSRAYSPVATAARADAEAREARAGAAAAAGSRRTFTSTSAPVMKKESTSFPSPRGRVEAGKVVAPVRAARVGAAGSVRTNVIRDGGGHPANPAWPADTDGQESRGRRPPFS